MVPKGEPPCTTYSTENANFPSSRDLEYRREQHHLAAPPPWVTTQTRLTGVGTHQQGRTLPASAK